jgi:hypothetical protein
MVMRKFIFTLGLLFFLSGFILAQTDELEPVEDAANTLGALLGDGENAIEKVRLISETEAALSIEVSFKGYKDKNTKSKGLS